ncbi:hypothetical protein BX600DRAFT_97018 [Xylariales sp. PMI_506]|nr:hypothetical protein BX600DRAFT_97018 [Xylariales sp. PMI_506]
MDAMDLDIDLDVDLVPEEPITIQVEDTPSPGEVVDDAPQETQESNALVPHKIFIRGLDVLNPDDIKTYVGEHYIGGRFERIEWIDDASANLVFASEASAQEALIALSSVEIADVTSLPIQELLPAKPYSKRSENTLQVRIAVTGDRKQAGAAQRSRFYLLNPEYDPENRKRYRDRDGDDNRRRRGRHPREDEPVDHFDVNLYDDDAGVQSGQDHAPRPRRHRSYSPDYDSDRRRRGSSHRNNNKSKELFPDHSGAKGSSHRDRSASPARDRDGDMGMDEYHKLEDSAERNRRGARAIKDRLSRSNKAKELFPSSAPSSESNRLEDADQTSSYLSSRFSLPLYDGSHDEPSARPKKLEDRITVPGGSGRLAERITDPADNSGFNIRGTATQKGGNQGFSIKGGANKTAKELFPDKLGSNAGKELFADKADGKSRRRQRAGDLFD